MIRLRWLSYALSACCVLLAVNSHAESWRFAAIGDTPYSDYEVRELPRLLDEIAGENVDLIVHVGDIKSSGAPCAVQTFRERRTLFDNSTVPLVYVPGDNEWADCRRLSAGHFDPLERLAKLREIFFTAPHSLGKRPLYLERQSDGYPEHQRWRLGPVLFLTLNVPGPDNHFGSGSSPNAEFPERNAQLVDWLRQGFAVASAEGLAGVVVAMQANPGFRHHAAGLAHAGFRDLLQTLLEETRAFSGQVLLIHGDTHWQRIDHPLQGAGAPLANFTRLETFGFPFFGWIKVVIDSAQPRLFRFESRPYRRR